jgi:inner membrane protein
VPTLLAHPAVPLALGFGLGRTAVPRSLVAAGVAAAVLPDLDVLAFRFGVPYADQLGHRGMSHSLTFALLVAVLGALALRRWRVPPGTSLWFLFVAGASHGLLDMLTTGGLGVALLWPWTAERFFAPVQVIRVSPLAPRHFLAARGLAVLVSELTWVWLPAAAAGVAIWLARRQRASARGSGWQT